MWRLPSPGLRPASTALIASAGLSVAWSVFTVTNQLGAGQFSGDSLAHGAAGSGGVRVYEVDPVKKLHPILFIAAAAVVGIIFQF